MFCPTAMDQYFADKFAILDNNHNTNKQSFRARASLEARKKEAEITQKK